MLEINKIHHGDCLELMKDIPDNFINLTITSPPYNMRTRVRDGQYTTRETSKHFSKKYNHFDDALSITDYYTFHKKVLKEILRVSKILFWNVQIVTGSKEAIFRLIGEFHKEIKDLIIWDKGTGQPAMHSNVINKATELIIIFEKDATSGRAFSNSYFERGTMEDIWRISNKKRNSYPEISACYPISLVRLVLNGWSKDKDLILDPFMGSGTTAVACKQLNRNFIGCEISEEYLKIANKRLEQQNLTEVLAQQKLK